MSSPTYPVDQNQLSNTISTNNNYPNLHGKLNSTPIKNISTEVEIWSKELNSLDTPGRRNLYILGFCVGLIAAAGIACFIAGLALLSQPSILGAILTCALICGGGPIGALASVLAWMILSDAKDGPTIYSEMQEKIKESDFQEFFVKKGIKLEPFEFEKLNKAYNAYQKTKAADSARNHANILEEKTLSAAQIAAAQAKQDELKRAELLEEQARVLLNEVSSSN